MIFFDDRTFQKNKEQKDQKLLKDNDTLKWWKDPKDFKKTDNNVKFSFKPDY